MNYRSFEYLVGCKELQESIEDAFQIIQHYCKMEKEQLNKVLRHRTHLLNRKIFTSFPVRSAFISLLVMYHQDTFVVHCIN